MPTLRILAVATLLLSSCGDQGPTAGLADPCHTPMGPVLGCRASGATPGGTPTAADACRKLVSCGILAAENFKVLSGTRPCTVDSDCAAASGQACQKASDGRLWCHTPVLDQRWCYLRLTQSVTDPCQKGTFSASVVRDIMRCVAATSCETLGLPFHHKTMPTNQRPSLDHYSCSDNKTHVWTATTCDHGLLQY
jgi:hypothetical protein